MIFDPEEDFFSETCCNQFCFSKIDEIQFLRLFLGNLIKESYTTLQLLFFGFKDGEFCYYFDDDLLCKSCCPDNCFCTESTLECIIDSCDLGFLDDYPVMILHGTLCEEHRQALRDGDS